jgi:hypothetical protein
MLFMIPPHLSRINPAAAGPALLFAGHVKTETVECGKSTGTDTLSVAGRAAALQEKGYSTM